MDNISVEKKWNKIWQESGLYKFDKNDTARKHYVLEMFSYPSGAKLHVGHWYNYALSDSYARFKKMQGFNVFEPMGFDSFGLPAENYAIKTGIHPQDSTLKNIEIMEEQLKNMGAMFDWDAEVKTCMPDYYKWTQWMFLKLYEKGACLQKGSAGKLVPLLQYGACKRTGFRRRMRALPQHGREKEPYSVVFQNYRLRAGAAGRS